MRLILLLICVFSLLGGCAASSSHGVVVPKLISLSGKQSSSPGINKISVQNSTVYTNDTPSYIDSDDIEDDDHQKDALSFRKFKSLAKYTPCYNHIITANFRCYGISAAAITGSSSPKYIVQKTLRV